MEGALQFPPEQLDQANKSLVTKIVSAMSEISLVPKKGFNQHSGYKYAGIEEIVLACRGPLAKNGLLLFGSLRDLKTEVVSSVQGKTLHWTRLSLRFVITDGESAITWDVSGEGMDQADKSGAKAWTSATKYALRSMLQLPIGDDPEADSPEIPSAPQRPQPPLVMSKPSLTTPSSQAQQHPNSDDPPKITDRQIKAIQALSRALQVDEIQLRGVISQRFGTEFLEALTRSQASQVMDLLKTQQRNMSSPQ
jgi:hypothetical protein